MDVRRLRVLALEVFRSVNKLNPVYVQSLFENSNLRNLTSKRYKDDIKVPIPNSVTLGDKSVMVLGTHIWNMLPAELKRKVSYKKSITDLDLNVTEARAGMWQMKLQLYPS